MERHSRKEDKEREYFRVDDTAMLEYQPILPEYVDEVVKNFNQSIMTIDAAPASIEEHFEFCISHVEHNNPNIARCLRILNNKINSLSREDRKESGTDYNISKHSRQEINISANGLAFYTSQVIPNHTILEIYLTLLPEHETLYMLGTVTRTERFFTPELCRYYTAVEFTHVHPCDQKKLMKHSLDTQKMLITQEREKKRH
jgi:hypothetical protein